MSAAHRRWLVDGSNLVGCRPDGWWHDRPGAFARLVEDLEGFAAASQDDITVVFDGGPVASAGPCVTVGWAPSADDRIVALAGEDVDPPSLTVVTSDRALGQRVRTTGASTLGAASFRGMLDDAVSSPPCVDRRGGAPVTGPP